VNPHDNVHIVFDNVPWNFVVSLVLTILSKIISWNMQMKECRNLNLGLTTKVRACKGVGQEGSMEIMA